MSTLPNISATKFDHVPEVEKGGLCLPEEMHHRHCSRETCCIGGQRRIEVGLPNVRGLTTTRSTIVVVPEGGRYEHAWNNDVAKAKHSKAPFAREEEGLRP